MSKDISLKVLESQDLEELAFFLEKMTQGEFLAAIWHDRFRLWWEINPAFTPGMLRGWVLCDSLGAIGGFIGNIPINYLIDGRVTVVNSATSWYVAEDFRGASLKLIRAFRKQNSPLLDTTPVENVAIILCKLGFKKLSQSWIERDGIYPLNHKLFGRIVADRFAGQMFPVVARILGIGVGIFVKLQQSLVLSRAVNSRFVVEEINEFDSSCTVLWDKLCKRYKISAVRDRAAMNWFFFGTDAIRSRRIVLALKEAGNLTGHIAFKIYKWVLGGNKYVYLELADIWMLSLTLEQYKDLFEEIFLFLRSKHKEVVYLAINSFNMPMFKALSQAGTFWIKGRSRFLYDKFPVIDGEGFFATPLDGDRCYFP